VSEPNYPPPYGFGLSKIKGWAGRFIALGQLLAGRPSKWQHAFLVLPGNLVIEAEPGGARVVPIDEYWNGTGWDAEFIYPPLTPEQRDNFVGVAMGYKGIPYGFLDYFSLLLLHLHIRLPFVKNFVLHSQTAICSQLVDGAYKTLGVMLFDDDRFPGDVMPSDLDWLAKHHPEWAVYKYKTNLEAR